MGAPASLPIAAAAALVLLALLAGGHCREAQLDAGGDLDAAGTENYNTSDAAVYWGPWQKARATWYGQPNGAGPDDNGEPPAFRDLFLPPSPRISWCLRSSIWAMPLTSPSRISPRWCVRVQAHQPVPVHVHGLLRQPATVQGRQRLRLLLQGKKKSKNNFGTLSFPSSFCRKIVFFFFLRIIFSFVETIICYC
jgi:hypothetical protein